MVASHKSFSKAAAELHLTQPAVTLQIKHLEQELGELLIDRMGRFLALTPAGEVFLTYVSQILNLAAQATETMQQFGKTRGRLTIGAGTTNTIFRLPQILQQYRASFPQIEIRIRSGDSDLITRLVEENAVDLGFITTVYPNPNLNIIPLFEDKIWLLGPENFPAQVRMDQLEQESFILFRAGSGFRYFLEEQFRAYQIIPKVTMELESIEAIIRLVESGLGLAFLPEIAVREELAHGAIRKIKIEGWKTMRRQTFLIYRRDKYLTWPIEEFLQRLPGQKKEIITK